ncbi:DUF4365 domain-containing protein [Microbacterium sp. NPDC087591]|uniref:DUF4365 domain-containing protein n=1 Tax=Microbacterium sp. NPDC087591 TaxID=3364192 RepID=UPI0038291D49
MKMRQPKARQLGARGQTAAKLFFESLGWGVIETSGDHDLGTDLLVQVRDKTLADMSLMFGVQVKTGDSWFKKRSKIAGKPGWIYSEKDQRHANYWSNHPLPHILLIQNADLNRRYWVFANRETIEPTKKGFKILVPEDQPLEERFRSHWEDATTQALKRVILEGARWSFDMDSVPPAAHARFALLAAHLVAPHPNRGSKEPLSWPQAVALCLSSGAERWEQNAARHSTVPTVGEASQSEDWGWRFAAAVYSWIYEADAAPLESLDSTSESRQAQIAHAVATAVALEDFDRLAEAAERLERLALETEESIEQAWISVHRAHLAMEQGDVEEARRLAQLGFAQLAPVGADVTASPVRAAAAWAMFDTAEMIPTDLGPVVSVMDNPSSWWRAQTTSGGLEAAVKQHFRAWSHDQSVTFGNEYASHNALHSATVQARLAGSFAQAKNVASLRAQVDLSIPAGDAPRTVDSLETLRSVGDEKALRLAIHEVARREPLSQLRELVSHVTPTTMTRTTSRADLRLLQHAGIYADPEHAHELVDFLLDALEDPQPFSDRVAARYLVVPALLESLAGLRDFLQEEQWCRFIDYVLSHEHSEVSAPSLARLLTDAQLVDDYRARLARALDEVPQWLQSSLRSAIGANQADERAQVRQKLLDGDLDGLSAIRGNLGELDADEAAAVTTALANAVDAEREHPIPAGLIAQERDDAGNLAKLCINFPDLEGWSSLIEFIADLSIEGRRKRQAALTLARNSDAIPAAVRPALLDAARSARNQVNEETSPAPTLIKDVGGAIDCLYASLLDKSDPDRFALTASLLAGSLEQRRDVSWYLASSDDAELPLAALLKDPDPEVASNAAAGMARLLRNSPEPKPAIVNLLVRLVEKDTSVAHAIVVGLGGTEPLHDNLRRLKLALQQHASVRVRKLAHALHTSDS